MKKLKCYFSLAITLLKQQQIKEYLEYYDFIERCLTKKHNVKVFNPIKQESKIPPNKIYWRDLHEVNKADFIIAEISVVSWGVGQELTYAIMRGRPVLALYNKASKFKLSEMIKGSGLRIREYDGNNKEEWKQQLTHHISEFMTELRQYLYLRKRLCAKIP